MGGGSRLTFNSEKINQEVEENIRATITIFTHTPCACTHTHREEGREREHSITHTGGRPYVTCWVLLSRREAAEISPRDSPRSIRTPEWGRVNIGNGDQSASGTTVNRQIHKAVTKGELVAYHFLPSQQLQLIFNFFFNFSFLRQGPCRPQTHDPLASASQALGFKVCSPVLC